jgi:hypothetical protein
VASLTIQNSESQNSTQQRRVALTGEAPAFIRRQQAGAYLVGKYGFGSSRTLAKAAVAGDGPEFSKAGRRVVLYTIDALDRWALSKIGGARHSTSDADGVK